MRLVSLLMMLVVSSVVVAVDEGQLEPGGVNPGFHEKPAWFKQSFLDLGEDVADAAAEGKRVMLYFHQDGCPYCAKLLQDNFGQRDIAAKTRRHFEVIAINMWGDREVTTLDGRTLTEKAFAVEMKVMYTPTLVVLDETGRNFFRINGYYHPGKFSAALDYAAGRAGGLGFPEYLKKAAPERASGKLHEQPFFMQPPYQLSRKGYRAERPLLVLFEQKVCSHCDEMHRELFTRPEVKDLLGQFDVVRLDMWSNTPLVSPEGKRLRAKSWAKSLNVQYAPTMVFFDRQGNEVFRSEAYLRAFHTVSVLEYVASGAYRDEPEFQRFVQSRAERLEAAGEHVDLWK